MLGGLLNLLECVDIIKNSVELKCCENVDLLEGLLSDGTET